MDIDLRQLWKTKDMTGRTLTAPWRLYRNGGIILYPTDTVWGIGCDAANVDAVEKIYRLKERSDSKAMLCLVDSEGMLQRSVRTVPDAAWQLIEAAVNPLTIIYDHPIGIAENLKADDGSLGIRITSEPFSSALCRRLRGPIVSTSANVSGKKTPRQFADIEPEIIDGVDYAVRFGTYILRKPETEQYHQSL